MISPQVYIRNYPFYLAQYFIYFVSRSTIQPISKSQTNYGAQSSFRGPLNRAWSLCIANEAKRWKRKNKLNCQIHSLGRNLLDVRCKQVTTHLCSSTFVLDRIPNCHTISYSLPFVYIQLFFGDQNIFLRFFVNFLILLIVLFQ